ELKLARSEISMKLYDQALATLHRLVSDPEIDPASATAAYFLIASIDESRGKTEDAMATYLEIAHRYEKQPVAAEALYRLGELAARRNAPASEADAIKTFEQVAADYGATPWAVRALMA